MKNRAKRHLMYQLLLQNATSFRVKSKYLNQKFEQLRLLISDMDDEFEKIIESRPEEFASVDIHNLFGTKVDAGFSYEDGTGKDTTYDEDNYVIFEPSA